MHDPNCVFCKIVDGRIPAKIVSQNERAVALLDAFPLAIGHTLIIPKAHYVKVQEMAREDSAAVFEILWKILAAVESASGAPASTIAIHNGKEAGQEVPHVHMHVIPRKPDDGAGPVHSMFRNRPKISSTEMDSMQNKITASIQ